MPYQVTPLWVYTQVLCCQNSPPLITGLLWLSCAVEAEVTATDRRIMTPKHPVHRSCCSPATVMGVVHGPSAAYALVTFSLIPQLLSLLHRHPVVGLGIITYRHPQLAQDRTDHASRPLQGHQHNRRSSAYALNTDRISDNSFEGTRFCSSSLTRTEPMIDLLWSPAITL